MEQLVEALCLKERKTPCLWYFLRARELSKEIKADLKKERRPGIVLEFLEAEGEKLEVAKVVFLSTKKLFPRQPKVEIGRECTVGRYKEVKKITSFVFVDLNSGNCLFTIPVRFLKDRLASLPCGTCKEEIKKRLLDECGED
ncbi:hypothetical protein [Thermovibrio sp.]